MGSRGSEQEWAVFLDLDGTLLDIAPRPSEVHVPPALIAALGRLSTRLGGALAIISGRPIEEIDHLLQPLVLPAAAEHGAALRLPDGTRESLGAKPPPAWIATLEDFARRRSGVLVEIKQHGLVVHFRQAPEHEAEIIALLQGLLADGDRGYELLSARRAFELRPQGAGKGKALKRLMKCPPFVGRRAVFIGDDVTDEAAIAAADELGGRGLHVGRNFAGSPEAVRAWVARAAESPHILVGDE